MTERFITADPYPWPYNGDLRPENTALIENTLCVVTYGCQLAA